MEKVQKARFSLANKTKTELIEDVKVLLAMLFTVTFSLSFVIGMQSALIDIIK